jgi:hypothetical protein
MCGDRQRCEQRCNLKWCPVCARKRSAQRCCRYSIAAQNMRWPMHITLTICNVGEISIEDIRALKAAFKRLRRTLLWRRCVVGGIVSLELTNTGKGWHPHLHILADAEWLSLETRPPCRADSRARKFKKCQRASAELERAWSACIGQMMSSIKVRRCSGEVAIREVLKYAVKPADLIDSPDAIGPAIRAISGGRNVTPFGTLYNLRSELREKPHVCKCAACGEVGTLAPEEVHEMRARKPRRVMNGHLRRGKPWLTSPLDVHRR